MSTTIHHTFSSTKKASFQHPFSFLSDVSWRAVRCSALPWLVSLPSPSETSDTQQSAPPKTMSGSNKWHLSSHWCEGQKAFPEGLKVVAVGHKAICSKYVRLGSHMSSTFNWMLLLASHLTSLNLLNRKPSELWHTTTALVHWTMHSNKLSPRQLQTKFRKDYTYKQIKRPRPKTAAEHIWVFISLFQPSTWSLSKPKS